MSRSERTAAVAVGALLGPLFVAGIYLSFSRWPERWFTPATDWAALGLAILVGLVGIWSLPMKRWKRVAATFLYIPAMGALVGISAVVFVCSVFGDCL